MFKYEKLLNYISYTQIKFSYENADSLGKETLIYVSVSQPVWAPLVVIKVVSGGTCGTPIHLLSDSKNRKVTQKQK